VVAMDNILETIYNIFIDKLKDLEMGHILRDTDLCEIWDLIHAYELLDNKIIGIKEQKQIIEYYG
jgi:hypothetical protein